MQLIVLLLLLFLKETPSKYKLAHPRTDAALPLCTAAECVVFLFCFFLNLVTVTALQEIKQTYLIFGLTLHIIIALLIYIDKATRSSLARMDINN